MISLFIFLPKFKILSENGCFRTLNIFSRKNLSKLIMKYMDMSQPYIIRFLYHNKWKEGQKINEIIFNKS